MKDLDPNSTGDYIVAPTEESMDEQPRVRRANWWIRGALMLFAHGFATDFCIATLVKPYDAAGHPLRLSSHTSMGMPPCRFKEMSGMPCPSCGMTTSFALLVRGDVWNSLRANWVGTGLAVGCALLIPWCLVSAVRGRYLGVRRIEAGLAFLVGLFTVTMLARWGVVLLLAVFGERRRAVPRRGSEGAGLAARRADRARAGGHRPRLRGDEPVPPALHIQRRPDEDAGRVPAQAEREGEAQGGEGRRLRVQQGRPPAGPGRRGPDAERRADPGAGRADQGERGEGSGSQDPPDRRVQVRKPQPAVGPRL